VADAILALDGLMKRFGGLVATDRISLDVTEGEVHAVIGPNGAGKTTLVSQIAGELRPDAGTIRFLGRDITALTPHRRSLAGLARSFQITSVFLEFTPLDNVMLAVQAHQGHSLRFWGAARKDPSLRDPALALLDQVGLSERVHVQTAHLAHGEKRALEIAMALAGKPRLLLLDEPTAGMNPRETEATRELVLKIRERGLAVVVIEHDMRFIFNLCDRVAVLMQGQKLVEGTPAVVQADERVIAAYLGEPYQDSRDEAEGGQA
jgi:branched-chain amino acid transport system ATP-binding protein